MQKNQHYNLKQQTRSESFYNVNKDRQLLRQKLVQKVLIKNLKEIWECFQTVILYFFNKFWMVCKPSKKPRN